MRRYAQETTDGLVEVTTRFFAGGAWRPARALAAWTHEELLAVGLLEITPAAPPVFGQRHVGHRLELIDGQAVEVADVGAVPLADLREGMFEVLGAQRWAHETGGITVAGVPLATDDRTQAKLLGAVVLFREDPSLLEVLWKVSPGHFETIPRDPGLAQGVAVGRFVQACFAHEGALTAAIHAAPDAAALAAIDLTAGWPATIINPED